MFCKWNFTHKGTHTNQGFQIFLLKSLVELNSTEKIAMISDGTGAKTSLFQDLCELLDANSAFQQGVLGM